MGWQEIIVALIVTLCMGLTLRYFWQVIHTKRNPCAGCDKSCALRKGIPSCQECSKPLKPPHK
uniref:hypothetical protein n=1 Tax=Alistipes sp. TaxID=1872444 RepID=UPI0040561E38